MCLAVPAIIIKRNKDQSGTIEMDGLKKDISLDLVPEAKVGDYVIVHVGYALSILDKEEAQKSIETMEAFREIR